MTAKKTKKSESPFKTGRADFSARRTGDGPRFLSIKPDESIQIAPLVGLEGMISADMHEYWDIRPPLFHPCIGYNCPGCKVENEPRFKGYLPVLDKESGEAAIYPFTKSVYDQLEDLEDALDDDETIEGLAIKIIRKGAGLKTRYTVMATGKRADVSGILDDMESFVERLGPATEGDIWELLEKNGFSKDGSFSPKEDGDDDEWGSV